MSSTPRLMSKPIPGITPEQARDTRARAWVYIFHCYEAKKNPAAVQPGSARRWAS
jgi:hypothetical protein